MLCLPHAVCTRIWWGNYVCLENFIRIRLQYSKQVLTDCPLRCPVNLRSRSIIASFHLSILYLGGNMKTLVQVGSERRQGSYTLCLGFENVEKWITEFLQRQAWRSED